MSRDGIGLLPGEIVRVLDETGRNRGDLGME